MKWCTPEDHFRSLIIFTAHSWLFEFRHRSAWLRIFTTTMGITYADNDINWMSGLILVWTRSMFGLKVSSSPPRNPSSGWIWIKKSKSGFFGFPFLSFDWEIRKRICKTVLVNSGLLFTNYACACKTAFPKDSFSNPFSDFPIER